ncbi:hypothetical protein KAH37_03020 [bacterium]|nr:hypothetical protein [bacterium]
MIDFHSHLLFSLDDGFTSIEESREALIRLRSLGFSEIVPTPHRFHPLYNPTVHMVKERIKELDSDMIHRFSFEYMYSSLIPDERQLFELGTTSFGSPVILLEFMPLLLRKRELEEILFLMESRGILPLLAHIERYNFSADYWQEIKSRYSVLLQGGLKSLGKGPFDAKKRQVTILLKKNILDNMATDIHSLSQLTLVEKGLEYLHKHFADQEKMLFSTPEIVRG